MRRFPAFKILFGCRSKIMVYIFRFMQALMMSYLQD